MHMTAIEIALLTILGSALLAITSLAFAGLAQNRAATDRSRDESRREISELRAENRQEMAENRREVSELRAENRREMDHISAAIGQVRIELGARIDALTARFDQHLRRHGEV
jgi:hypothetical protein